MKALKFNREQLYDLVWSNTMVSLAKKYLASDAELRKICKKMSIPLPKAGHWEKLRAGKPVFVEELPTTYTEEQEVELFLREEGDEGVKVPQSPETALRKEIENDPTLSLAVPLKLSNPDELIIAYKNSLKEKYPDYRSILNIRVSQENLDRALRFMDTLIKCLRKRGHNVFIDGYSSCVNVGNQKINIHLREKQKREIVPTKYNSENTEYHPTGILIFQYYEHSWRRTDVPEGKFQMENMVGIIIAKLEVKAINMKAERIELEKGWAEQAEERRIEQEAKQKIEKELSDFKGLLRDAERWRQVEILHNYINSVEAKAVANNDTSEELKNWLEWARKKADWYAREILEKKLDETTTLK